MHQEFDEVSYLGQQYETLCLQQQQNAISYNMSADQKLGTSHELTEVETPAPGDMLDDIEEVLKGLHYRVQILC